MKTKKLKKEISLNRQTVAILNENMENINGGKGGLGAYTYIFSGCNAFSQCDPICPGPTAMNCPSAGAGCSFICPGGMD